MFGITRGASDRIKPGVEKILWMILSGGSCKGARDGRFEDGSEELEESSIIYSLVEEGGYEIG